MAIYFDNSNITTGSRGPEGPQGIQGPQGPAGPNEISTETASSITGILKGNGSTVQTAIAGTDYATPDDAKVFLVTFIAGESGVTADKTIQEILAAYETGRMVLGIILHPRFGTYILLQLSSVQGPEPRKAVTFTAFNTDSLVDMVVILGINRNGVDQFFIGDINLTVNPASATALPASGTALTANTIYAVADAVGTYAFTPPDTGWAHGKFTTGSSVSVSFAGTFLGTAPTIEASKTYEFDVFDGVWAVQEVVSA